MRRLAISLLCITFIFQSISADSFSKELDKKYVICPNCLTLLEIKKPFDIEQVTCTNKKCNFPLKLSDLQAFESRDKAAFFKYTMWKDRYNRANKMGIKDITATCCPYCKDKIHLNSLEVLDMIEGRRSRLIECDIKSCKHSYDIIDGVKTYEIVKAKEYRDYGAAMAMTAICLAALANSGSSGGGYANPGQIYVPSYTRNDGTTVRSHYRTYPDGTIANNFGQPSYAQLQQYKDLKTLPTYMYDFDGDGIANQYDFDDDNDGIGDNYDKDPYNASVY